MKTLQTKMLQAALGGALLLVGVAAVAQATNDIEGTVTDSAGGRIPGAQVTLKEKATGRTKSVVADQVGHFAANVPAGSYEVIVDAIGFGEVIKHDVTVTAGTVAQSDVNLQVQAAIAEITVDADATHSEAAALAVMDATLDETSARTEITPQFLQNFVSPIADYGEAVNYAPGTFTLSSNGVGIGQSKTYFRGFPDGYYDIDYDGIPFYDTNSPTHHSWVFFPSQFIGSIDFDRSPGTASTYGPTPFGGSIHLFSKDLSPVENLRGQVSYGSYNTQLYDFQFDSGRWLDGKLSLHSDIHHLQTDGYQTWNHQTNDDGDIKVLYKFSDRNYITGYSGVQQLTANAPNFNATRCQMFGPSVDTVGTGTYTCSTPGFLFHVKSGVNFLLTDTSDPYDPLSYQWNHYHIPSDFEYVGWHREFGKSFTLNFKGYTYNYDNGQLYATGVSKTGSKINPIIDSHTVGAPSTYHGVAVVLCDSGTIWGCGIDKLNSYRKYGETGEITQTNKFGTLRAGMWYEWARTSRHQFPTDPANNWQDQALSNFNEYFYTNSYQPYVEFAYRVTPKLTITPGVKFSYFTIATKQFADNGTTIGGLGTNNPNTFISNAGSYFATLPAVVGNYRILNNWSAYGQFAEGTIVPPSSVFDFNQGASGQAIPPTVAPKQQRNTTYQFGSVVKLKKVTLNGDVYFISFDNSYSSVTDSVTGEPDFYLQPGSKARGVELQANLALGGGFSIYANGSTTKATYTGSLGLCPGGAAAYSCPAAQQYLETVPAGLNVQQTPSDLETEALTYQHKSLDVGFVNKRVGTFYIDNGSYHNQATIPAFTSDNFFFNYTVRSGGRFDNTKFRLSVNNLFDAHSLTGVKLVGAISPAPVISANGTTYADAFNTNGPTAINGGDNTTVLAGRSILMSVTFGFSPKGR